jgi:hypothetical protein
MTLVLSYLSKPKPFPLILRMQLPLTSNIMKPIVLTSYLRLPLLNSKQNK